MRVSCFSARALRVTGITSYSIVVPSTRGVWLCMSFLYPMRDVVQRQIFIRSPFTLAFTGVIRLVLSSYQRAAAEHWGRCVSLQVTLLVWRSCRQSSLTVCVSPLHVACALHEGNAWLKRMSSVSSYIFGPDNAIYALATGP